MKIAIKNMVCPRCITSVAQLLTEVGIVTERVSLGEAVIADASEEEMDQLKTGLQQRGFELLEDDKEKTIAAIKSLIINHIHHSDANGVVFSELLANQLHKDYSGLSKLFSSETGNTIEHFIILQKIEKVKELLQYGELTLSEIADKMGYSSVAHLSAQFKKITGLTPTAFKAQASSLRKPLDKIS